VLLPKKLVLVTAGGAALALASTLTLFACGPSFPDWILGGDGLVLNGPTAQFDGKVMELLGTARKAPASLEEAYVPFPQASLTHTAAADRADLEEALATARVEGGKRGEILAAHAALREGIGHYGEAVARWREEAAWADPKPPRPAFEAVAPGLAVPAGLPAELDLYLRGALAYHREDWKEAHAAWERLLALPAGERRHRSTWAVFMLGRAAEGEGGAGADDRALARYRETRELAAHGFADRLGLAVVSLGWEARIERRRGHWARAVDLYVEQQRKGEETALLSLRQVCRAAFRAEGETVNETVLAELARDATARPVATAYLLAASDYPGMRDDAGKAWLAAVQKAQVENAAEAADLAWLAYLSGDFDGASAWVARAPAKAPMARWVKAKLLLRQGKIAEGGALLSDLSRSFPVPPGEEETTEAPMPEELPLATRARAAGEAGVVLLHQGRYAEALDRLLAGGYWVDAAYVAERVLTLDELAAYVDANWPLALAEKHAIGGNPETAGLGLPKRAEVASSIRYLLGRRLARAGRPVEAKRYLPRSLAETADLLAAAAAPSPPAAALWRAACAARQQGLAALGTEIGPDWFRWGGQFEVELNPADRGKVPDGQSVLLAATADEAARDGKHRAETDPWKRFHYRYRAAELARRAAAALPDGNEQKAQWLSAAGNWLQNRDAPAARPFYQEIQRCCGKTAVGKAVAKTGRFPTADVCAAPVP